MPFTHGWLEKSESEGVVSGGFKGRVKREVWHGVCYFNFILSRCFLDAVFVVRWCVWLNSRSNLPGQTVHTRVFCAYSSFVLFAPGGVPWTTRLMTKMNQIVTLFLVPPRLGVRCAAPSQNVNMMKKRFFTHHLPGALEKRQPTQVFTSLPLITRYLGVLSGQHVVAKGERGSLSVFLSSRCRVRRKPSRNEEPPCPTIYVDNGRSASLEGNTHTKWDE